MPTEEITVQELLQLSPDKYFAVDIRDRIAFAYGALPGAINLPQDELMAQLSLLPREKPIVVYCKSGILSEPVAEALREQGYHALNLKEGYYGYMLQQMTTDENKAKEVERSLHKKFHKTIWSKFTAAILQYELLQPGDQVAVCISGGKDSMLMAKLFQELKRHNKYPFELVYLVMDPGYSPENRTIIEQNARRLQVPITIFETDIFASVLHVEKSPCYLCARMRRGHLYKKAQELGCNKIALGHHYDDVIETNLMGMLYGGQIQTMMPKLHSTNFPGMELIRPLYLVPEAEIKRWRDYNDLHFIQCACKFTETCTSCNPDNTSKRQEIKHMIAELQKINPQVRSNIFRSMENVNLDTVLRYKKGSRAIHFLDTYESGSDLIFPQKL